MIKQITLVDFAIYQSIIEAANQWLNGNKEAYWTDKNNTKWYVDEWMPWREGNGILACKGLVNGEIEVKEIDLSVFDEEVYK